MPSCRTINKFENMMPTFYSLTQQLGININTNEGRTIFGQAANYFVNSERCSDKIDFIEHLRFYTLVGIKIIILGFLIVSSLINVLPIDKKTYKNIENIQNYFNNSADVLIGFILFIMFWPSHPAHIYTQTDLLFAFASGVLLMLNGVSNLITADHTK